MDKYLIKLSSNTGPGHQTTLELLGDTMPEEPQLVTIGVLGNSSAKFWNRETVAENILNPLIGYIGRMPDAIMTPTEGASSTFLQVWAEKHKVACSVIEADWIRMGRRARALRDSKIVKEASHLVFFLGNRSDYYEKMAIREVKKGKVVFTIDPQSNEIAEWVV